MCAILASPPYVTFGNLLVSLRDRAGIGKQTEFAKLVKTTQQTVSRWEKGHSRPRDKDIPLIAQVLKAPLDELMVAAGYSKAPPAADTFDKPLPVHALSPESFERFCTEFLERLYRSRNGRVHRAGGSGHTQDGIDIMVESTEGVHTFQCKRVAEFGPKKVLAAVAKHTLKANKKFLLLSLASASPKARAALVPYPEWDLWDQEDISLHVRKLPRQEQIELVDTFFRGQRLELLGEAEAGPWMKTEKFFAPFLEQGRVFSHRWNLVGRRDEASKLKAALDDQSVRVTILVGAAGRGKTRLLREALADFSTAQPNVPVWVLSPTEEPTAKSLEGLGILNKLLVVDDAHDRDDLTALFRHCAELSNGSRLLLTMRPYGRDSVRNQAALLSLTGTDVREVELAPTTRQEAQTLAAQVLAEADGPVHVADDIAKLTFDSPLATVIGAHIVARERTNPILLGNHEEFRRSILSRFEVVVTGDIAKGQDVERLRKILQVIALVQPIHPDEPRLLTLLERVEGIQLSDATRLLKLLVSAGVLFRRGLKYRLSPDLLADSIIERSCIGMSQQSSGYAEQVFEIADAQYLKHILVNLAKLDWRQREGDTSESELLSGLWKQLRWQDQYVNPHLEAAEAVAYYQPKQALLFARQLIKEGHGVDRHVSAILKHAAYNLAYLEEACQLLWEAGREDGRDLNQNPGHSVRILKELASPEPNKPPVYVEKVVDFALALLKRPLSIAKKHTPFEILEGALATEGHMTTASTSRAITWTTFSVSPESVASIRKRIIDTLLECLTSESKQIAYLAASTLAAALRGPHGVMGHKTSDAEHEVWRTEHQITLHDLHQLLLRHYVSPAVLVRIATSVAWHAHHGIEDKRQTPQEIIKLLERDLRTRVIRVLIDGWGTTTWPFDGVTHKRSLHEAESTTLVKALNEQFPGATSLFDYMESCLVEIGEVSANSGGHHIFVQRLIEGNVDLATLVVEACFSRPTQLLARFGGFAFGTLLNRNLDATRTRIEEILKDESPHVLQLVAEAYVRFVPRAGYTPSDVQALRLVFASKDPTVLWYASNAIRQVAEHDSRLAVDLITLVDIAAAGKHAHDLLMWIGHDDTIPFDVIRADQLERIVGNLRGVRDLDDHWTRTFLKKAMVRVPDSVIQLVKDRICDSLVPSGSGIRPLDDGVEHEHSLGMLELEKGPAHLADLLNWALNKPDDGLFLWYFGETVAGLCGKYSDTALAVFEAWMTGGSRKHVEVVGAILRRTYPDFIYDHEGFVDRILETANAIDNQSTESLCSSIYACAASRGGVTTPGEPFPHDVGMKEHAARKLASLSRMDPAYELYRWLLEDADRGIEQQRREKEAMDAEDEEAL